MKLKSLSKEALKKIADMMVLENHSDAETWQLISSLTGEQSLATRIVEWLPEAFGYVLISRIPGVVLPTTFNVKDANGAWHELPFTAEPLTREAIELGVEAIDSGSGDVFAKISLRSSIVAAVNSALNAGADISEATISGPAFVNLPAEIYLPTNKAGVSV
ncbi:MAG: hypothetical protein ACYC0F_14645 [Rhodanobacter sp.]